MSVVTSMAACLADTSWLQPDSGAITVTLNTHVTNMSLTGDLKSADTKIQVTTVGATPTTTFYDKVFTTTAMAPLQRIDLDPSLALPPSVLDGIRSLSYDRATKVVIKFKSRWWSAFYPPSGPLTGGISKTDLPLSNVVYPSWDDGPSTPAVLMVSYTWS